METWNQTHQLLGSVCIYIVDYMEKMWDIDDEFIEPKLLFKIYHCV
jgi:hypothetical protein